MKIQSLFDKLKKANKTIEICPEEYYLYDKITGSTSIKKTEYEKDLQSLLDSESWVLFYNEEHPAVGVIHHFVQKSSLENLLK